MTTDDELDREIREAAQSAGASGTCLDGDTLARFYEDTLSGERADEVLEHLATCPACLEIAQDARAFVEALHEAHPVSLAPRPLGVRYAVAAFVGAIALLAGTYSVVHRRPASPEPWANLAVEPAAYDELVWRSGEPTPALDPLDAAMRRYRAADYAGAVDDLAPYVDAHPGDPRGRFYLGVARLVHGDPAGAAADLEAAIALDGAPADTAWYLALAHLRSGDPAAARPALERLAASDGPRRDDALAVLRALDEGGPP